MFGLGFSEIIFLALLALVVIGPKQLPEVARTLGKFLNELRRTTSVLTDDLKSHMKFDPLDLHKPPQNSRPPTAQGPVHSGNEAPTTVANTTANTATPAAAPGAPVMPAAESTAGLSNASSVDPQGKTPS